MSASLILESIVGVEISNRDDLYKVVGMLQLVPHQGYSLAKEKKDSQELSYIYHEAVFKFIENEEERRVLCDEMSAFLWAG